MKTNKQTLRQRWCAAGKTRIFALCLAWGLLVGLIERVGPPNDFHALAKHDLATVDLRFQLRGTQTAPKDIIILGIDQPSTSLTDRFDPLPTELAALKNFPYPRRVYAEAIERLCAAGAKVVALDLLFFSPKDDDAILQAAIAKHADRVVLVSNFSDDGSQLLEPSVVAPDSVPLESVAGYANYWPDVDATVRRARVQRYRSDIWSVARFPNEQAALSFAAQITRKAAPTVTLPDWEEATNINFLGPSGTVRTIPFYQLFYKKSWNESLQAGAAFRDKIVLIGPTGNFQHDQHPTPWGAMDGVEIHANTVATLLHGTAPRDATPWTGWLAVAALALAAGALLQMPGHPLLKLLLLLVVGAVYFAVAQLAFTRALVLLLVASPWWTLAGAGVLGISMQVLTEQLEKRRVRRTLEKYVSKPVADEILRHSNEYQNSLGGQRKHVTILFSDIRGFTSISEETNPAELVAQLNEYFTAMVEIVMKHDGTLDKYIGDALMAVYGSPLSAGITEDAWRATQTAAEMREQLTVLQKKWAREGRRELKIGIGINHGEVLVGNIGSPQRMEYTVIGDPVNVASRVEGLNKEFGTDILMTESVYELVKDRVEAELAGATTVKGRAQTVNIYLLKGIRR